MTPRHAPVPEEGGSLGELQGRFPLQPLVSDLKGATYPVREAEPAVEVTIGAGVFGDVFAADVPAAVTEVLAVAQRPSATSVFTEAASAAARRTKPSWALVADADRAIDPEVERFGAERAGPKTVGLDGASHAVAVSRPVEVAGPVLDAVRATG